ncbi:MAG TPA: serine hydrolase domain-containing protein [Gemmatimonadales bacterium]|nr:serine hydrolase domain-containing protein [Gemmatimonadales bacterium]
MRPLSCALVLLLASTGGAAAQYPLRTDPVDSVVADLRRYIPGRMAEDRVPGMAVALLRGGRVAWVEGFGVGNALGRAPVTPATPFPAASLGKALVAYAAARAADRGVLGLDDKVGARLGSGWSADTSRRDRVTVRHLLTHTSGLSNFLGDRERRLRFEPGDSFAYSGVGFMVLQEALASTAGDGDSLDGIVARDVLDPLGIGAARFGRGAPGAEPSASGHIPLGRAIVPFGLVFLPLWAVARLALWRARRLRGRGWIAAAVAAAGATGFLLSRAANPRLVPFFVGAFVAYALVALAGGLVAARVLRARRWAAPIGALPTGLLLFALLRGVPVPVPDGTPPGGNAASSLRADAAGLARLLAELARPTLLTPAMAAELRREHVRVSDHVAWGLGIALQRAPGADALFHWGSNPAARAAMIVYPASGSGVVVLANSGTAGDAVVDVVQRALGGPPWWADE